jgi:hypothetical protein
MAFPNDEDEDDDLEDGMGDEIEAYPIKFI